MDSFADSPVPDLDDTNARQAALRRYHVLDTAPETDFDRITSLVARVCDVPTALITLIDEERQWFKSCFGFDQRETDLEVSFCVHAVHQGELLVVEDATTDPRFEDNPLVTEPPHIRFYAGAPLTTPDGVHIGTLCIIDYEPRTFDAAQREILENLADTVVAQFELRSAEAQIRQLVEENPQPMYVYAEADGALLDANAAAREQYGYDAAAWAGLTVDALEVPAPEQPEGDRRLHERADGSRFRVRLRERAVRYDGREARLAVPQPVTGPAAAPTTVAFRATPDGTVRALSEAWTTATDVPVAAAVGHALLDLVAPADRTAATGALSPLFDGTASERRHEARLHTADGLRPFEIHARRLHAGDDEPAEIVGTLRPTGPETTPRPDASDDSDAEAAPADDAPDAAPEAPPSPDPAPDDVFSPRLPSFDDPIEAARAETDPPDEPTDTTPLDAASTEPPAPNDAAPDDAEPADPAPTDAPDDEAPAPFDLTTRLRALVDDRDAEEPPDALTVHASLPEASVPVRLPPTAVDDLVGTLLDNALTHTDEGTVSLRLTPDDETVRVTITDTGTGVEDRFMQVYMNAGSDAGDAPALQRVHQQATRLGGALDMDGAEEGTQFTLTLPRSQTDAPPSPGPRRDE